MIDIGSNYCGRNPGKFLLNTVMELPMIVPGAEGGSLVTWELYIQRREDAVAVGQRHLPTPYDKKIGADPG